MKTIKKYANKILIVLLALCTFLCVPSTVYASDNSINVVSDVYFSYGAVDSPSSFTRFSNKSLPFKFYSGSINQIGLVSIIFNDVNIQVDKNDVITIRLKQSETQYPNYFSLSPVNSKRAASSIYVRDSNDNYYTCGYDEAYYKDGYFVYEDVTVPVNGYIDGFDFAFQPQYIDYVDNWQSSYLCSFTLEECTVTVESENKNILNKLSAWFTNLFESLKEMKESFVDGFANIGKWFTDLGNNIKTWFTNLSDNISGFFTELKNNLTEWFKNVGNWFSELGNSIGEFFTNIWNNISDSITNITDSVHNWWQGVLDWLNNLFKVSDDYFSDYTDKWNIWLSDHLGFLYQAYDLIYCFFEVVVTQFDESYVCVIKIPSIVLPFGNVVISEAIDFDLASYITSNDTFNLLYQLFRGFAQGCCFLWLFNWSIDQYQKRFGGDSG